MVVVALGLMSGCNCGPTPTPAATGFSQVHLGAHAEDGLHVSLVLDADDQPMIAFVKVDTADAANNAVYFTRYDGAAAAWKTPVLVAGGAGRVNSNTGMQQVWLARDASTGRLGVAFQKVEEFCKGVNLETSIHVTFSTDQGATWSASERVSEAHFTRNDPVNGVAVCDAESPRIAMANGTVHVAWGADAGEMQPSQLSFWVGYYHASSTTPGTWTRTLLPANGDDARKGTGVLSLAFDGVKPRIAALLTRSATDRRATWMLRSDDGAAFTEVRVPDDASDQGGEYMDLSWAGGKGVLAYRYGSSSTRGQCGGPKLSRSSDAASWTTCGADDQTHQFLGNYVSAELAKSGKLVLAFHTPYADEASPGRWERGIVVWREP